MGALPSLIDLGQSPWLDNLRRDWLESGEIGRWIDRGVRGITSNPTIFAKALAAGSSYDAQLSSLLAGGAAIESAYWTMAIDDIRAAADLLRPIYDVSDRTDGFVSLEVSPTLAHDTAGSLASALDLWQRVERPNLMVKIPGTAAGLPAIRDAIAAGVNVNVTLLFSVERHDEVMEAYLSGLEARDGDLSGIASVASFFVSRVDTKVDDALAKVGTPEALALQGRIAIDNAVVAYAHFTSTFSGARWDALEARGARPQRPLWASTSSKNPAYADTIYVDPLIGPDTVNTMPENTLEAFDDHGTLARTVDASVDASVARLSALSGLGISLDDIAATLESEGVASFAASFDELLDTLTASAARLSA